MRLGTAASRLAPRGARSRSTLTRGRLHELLDLPTSCSSEVARRQYLQEAKRVHPDAGGSASAFVALNRAWREFSLAPPPPPVHDEVVTFAVEALERGARCGRGFWSPARIEAVRQATWRAARDPNGVLAAYHAAAADFAAAADAEAAPATVPDTHACSARLEPNRPLLRLEMLAEDPQARALLTSHLHRARDAVVEQLRRALVAHDGGAARSPLRLRLRGSVTQYTR